MTAILLCPAALMFVLRLFLIHRFWTLPLKHGKEFFLAQRVEADFYEGAGKMLLRRYRASLFVPIAVDAPVVAWLVIAHRYSLLSLEQIAAYFAGLVAYSVVLIHFGIRAADIAGPGTDQPVKTLQLSMAPRRLRDHTKPAVELVIAGAIILAAAFLWHAHRLAQGPGAHDAAARFRGGVVLAVWIMYWQLGAVLLKIILVRTRMPLPVNRTEDFRRWRGMWLDCNLKILDAIRVMSAVVLPWASAWLIYQRTWSTPAIVVVAAGSLLILGVFTVYVRGGERRLLAAQKELKPVEMVKEFPRRPIAEGRFLAGGLLYFNRDNPSLLVRSPHGVAINLSHPSTYAWTAYFAGLLVLITWMSKG